jgi:uncharacterized membrane-anchored protein YhcB (DUF1043 family)
MSVLWTIPVLAVVIGTALVIQQLRFTSGAAAELTDSLRRLHEVRAAVDEVRRQGGICGQTAAQVRTRHARAGSA